MTENSWQAIPLEHSLAEHAPEWDSLNHHFNGGHPMFDSRFVGGLLRYFGQGDEHLLKLRDEENTTGLCLLRPHRPGIWTSFFPPQAQVSPVLGADGIPLREIFSALPGVVGQIDFLGQDPDYSPVPDTLAEPSHSVEHVLTMSIRLDGDFERYWEGRSKNLSKNINRHNNRIAQEGLCVNFKRVCAKQEIKDAVARYGVLESSGWKGKLGTAVSSDNEQGAFYTAVLEQFAETGQACIYEFWIGDRLAASRLTISNQRMLIILKTAYDESMANFSPGRLLLNEVIRDAFSRFPGGTIEFYTNATRDQLAWATDQRYITHRTRFRGESLSLLRQLAKSFNVLRKDESMPTDTIITQCFSGNWDEQLTPEHLGLFSLAEKNSFELGWPWFQNLLANVFRNSNEPRIYSAHVDGRMRALLPLLLAPGGVRERADALGNYYTALYSPILASDTSSHELREIIRTVSKDNPALAEMRFSPLDPESSTTIALRNALQEAGWVTFSYFCFGNWYLPVKGSWQIYLESLGGQTRSTIRRMGKKFSALGGHLQIVSESSDIETAVAAFQRVYVASWKKPEPYPDFMPGLIRMLAATKRLRMGIAWLSGQPIASQIWVLNYGKASIYKLAYDEGFSALSPGTLLTATLMEHLIDQDQVREIDYLIGDDLYKQSWMTHRRERWGIVAYNPRRLRGLARLCGECLGRTGKWIIQRFPFRPGEISRTSKRALTLSGG